MVLLLIFLKIVNGKLSAGKISSGQTSSDLQQVKTENSSQVIIGVKIKEKLTRQT